MKAVNHKETPEVKETPDNQELNYPHQQVSAISGAAIKHVLAQGFILLNSKHKDIHSHLLPLIHSHQPCLQFAKATAFGHLGRD